MTDVGSTLPSFELPDADGKSVDISKFKGKNIVLVFYPAAFTAIYLNFLILTLK